MIIRYLDPEGFIQGFRGVEGLGFRRFRVWAVLPIVSIVVPFLVPGLFFGILQGTPPPNRNSKRHEVCEFILVFQLFFYSKPQNIGDRIKDN